jgi:NitT/TauT family transport system ATP-binding protein
MLDLISVARKYPWQLSGGMQQRVAIARAIVTRPRSLLLDEPFASLDAITKFDLEDLLLQISAQYKMTVVIVTHDLDEAIYLSDRVYKFKWKSRRDFRYFRSIFKKTTDSKCH